MNHGNIAVCIDGSESDDGRWQTQRFDDEYKRDRMFEGKVDTVDVWYE